MPRPIRVLSVLVALLGAVAGAGETVTPLVDLAQSAPLLTDRDFRLEVVLPKVGPQKAEGRADVHVELSCVAGAFAPGTARTPGYNGATHRVDASRLVVKDGTIAGELAITVLPDQWVPKDKKIQELTCRVDLALLPAEPHPDDQRERAAPTRGVGGTAAASDGQPNPVSGRVLSASAPGRFHVARVDGGAAHVRFDLGGKRVNWTNARSAVVALPAGALAGAQGLRVTVRPDRPRPEADVSLFLREGDGSWYYLKSAVPLIDAENRAVARFADFSEAEWVAPFGGHIDEDFQLDLASVTHLGIGVINPHGIGEVALAITGIDLVREDVPSPTPVRLAVSGRTLAVNGHELIPAGIFGGYAPDLDQKYRPGCQRALSGPVSMKPPAAGETEAFEIDCWFDRGSAAVMLGDRNWKANFAKWGREYAEKAKAADYAAVLEFWNEPYLNWATKPGKNYTPSYYNLEEAAEDAPVRIVYKGKAKDGTAYREEGPVVPHLAWRKDGDKWKVVDTTQFTYWSAKANCWLYNQMLGALAPALKEANPKVTLVAGWGFRWNEDHWAAWDILYQPTIDQNIAWIDGVHEHHYQGDVTAMPGTYEVLTAYGVTRHKKWLYSYNTETNDLLDAPARGGGADSSAYKMVVYNLRDCLYTVMQTPDKARARTVIHPRAGAAWVDAAYGLMRDLRGRLVECTSSDPGVWVVASIDGTDPKAMPPKVDGNDPGRSLVVVAFNDHRAPRTVELAIEAPAGMAFDPARNAVQHRILVDRKDLSFERVTKAFAQSGRSQTMSVDLPERTAVAYVLPLTGEPPATAQVRRSQHFSPVLLQAVRRDAPVTCPIAIPSERLAAAKRAWLRLVVEDVAPGEGVLRLTAAGKPPVAMTLPTAWTADNVVRIVEIPVEVAALAGELSLEFSVAAGNHAGYRVDMASVVVEERD